MVGVPFNVMANAFDELSIKQFDWQVSSEVPDIAVNGVVLGVNAEV